MVGGLGLKALTRIFLKGLFAILPIALSIYILLATFHTIDSLLLKFIPPDYSHPGIGFLILVLLIFLLGLLLSGPLFSKLYGLVELPFKKIPFLKSIYNALVDFMHYFQRPDGTQKAKVVIVQLDNFSIIGLQTQENMQAMNFDKAFDRVVPVFIPMSYAFGGYTIFVEPHKIRTIDMKVETAIKLSVTAWMQRNS